MNFLIVNLEEFLTEVLGSTRSQRDITKSNDFGSVSS